LEEGEVALAHSGRIAYLRALNSLMYALPFSFHLEPIGFPFKDRL
jgi:hypothetical protein